MKRKLSLILALIMILSVNTYVKAETASDLQGHWAAGYIQDWLNRGYISLYPDGTFKPSALVTRAEFFSFINGAFGFKTTSMINFSDVRPGSWYYNTVAAAVAAGYVTGYSDNTIQPERYITREEAASIITTIAFLSPYEIGAGIYNDISQTHWSRALIGAVSNAGIMQGYSDGTFRPSATMSRAEAVTALSKALVKRGLSTGVYVQPLEFQVLSSNYYTPITANTGSSTTSSSSSGNWDYDWDFETIISSSSFGTTREDTTINGNVRIDVNNATLRNVEINGDLVISSGVRGTINLNNVYVRGTIYIEGSPRLVLTDSDVYDIYVNGGTGTRITARGTSTAGTVYLYSPAVIEEESSSLFYGFEGVVLEEGMRSGSSVELYGNFPRVDVNASRARVYVSGGTVDSMTISETGDRSVVDIYSGAKISLLDIYARNTSFTGNGKIESVSIYERGTTFSKAPDKVHSTYDYDVDDISTDYGDYNLTVIVMDKGDDSYIDKATVEIERNGITTDTTDSEGEAVFNDIASGSYTVTVTKAGYLQATKTVSVTNTNSSVTIYLDKDNTPTYTYTFIVTDGTAHIDGAEITVTKDTDADVKTTGTNGAAVFTLHKETYTYTVKKEGFDDAAGTITVSETAADNIETVTLVSTPVEITVTIDDPPKYIVSGADVTLTATVTGGTADDDKTVKWSVEAADSGDTLHDDTKITEDGGVLSVHEDDRGKALIITVTLAADALKFAKVTVEVIDAEAKDETELIDAVALGGLIGISQNIALTAPIAITKNITLVSIPVAGARIIAEENQRHFTIDGSTTSVTVKLEFDRVMLDGDYNVGAGDKVTGGGGISITGEADVTLENAIIENCLSTRAGTGVGGGIFIKDVNGAAKLKLYGTTVIKNNYAFGFGGGVYGEGCEISVGQYVKITGNKLIIDPTDTTRRGGGIYITVVGTDSTDSASKEAALTLVEGAGISGNSTESGEGDQIYVNNFTNGTGVDLIGVTAEGNDIVISPDTTTPPPTP